MTLMITYFSNISSLNIIISEPFLGRKGIPHKDLFTKVTNLFSILTLKLWSSAQSAILFWFLQLLIPSIDCLIALAHIWRSRARTLQFYFHYPPSQSLIEIRILTREHKAWMFKYIKVLKNLDRSSHPEVFCKKAALIVF